MRQRSREGSNARDEIPHVHYNDIDSISRSSAMRASRKLRDEEEILSLFLPVALISGFDVDYGPELSRTSPHDTKRRDREYRGTRLRVCKTVGKSSERREANTTTHAEEAQRGGDFS